MGQTGAGRLSLHLSRGKMDEVNDMDKRAFKNLITKRSSIWTISLCMTGILVLGGIAAVDKTRRANEAETESEMGQVAYLEEEITESPKDIEDELFPTLDDDSPEDLAQASGSVTEENVDLTGDESTETADEEASGPEDVSGTVIADDVSADASSDGAVDGTADFSAKETISGQIISEQTLLQEGISFSEENTMIWPVAGTILIDYSMDGSVYFPTLNQYKYNPALIIGSEIGNQVLASAKGIVESVGIDEETGNTLVLNIGNGFKLTYGQLKELAVSEGDVVEEGAVLGYVSEPTRYYIKEGGNLYFAMTKDEEPVDPVLYL